VHILNAKRRQTGFVLIAIVAIVAIIALAFFAKWAMSDVQRRLGQNIGMSKVLSKVDLALVSFVAQHRRLPCPANGLIANGTANVGLELASCASQVNGVLPWVTLGLSEDESRDPWGARLTYRVDPALTGLAPRLMDMSNCDVSGTGSVAGGGACRTPTPTCVANPATCTPPATFLAGKGLDVWDGVGGAGGWATRVNNRVLGTGAAYVVISHGETGAGAYNAAGVLQPGTIGPIALLPLPGTQRAGDDEMPNLADLALTLPATQATTYRAAKLNTSISLSHFDDYLSHPSISEILKKASLQQRVH
jgi:hypothetical protein